MLESQRQIIVLNKGGASGCYASSLVYVEASTGIGLRSYICRRSLPIPIVTMHLSIRTGGYHLRRVCTARLASRCFY